MSIHLFILNKKKQIPSERLYRGHFVCVWQWQGTWLCEETSIYMKHCNMNDILCDKWNKKLVKLHNLNTKYKKRGIQRSKLDTSMKDVRKKYKLRYLN